MGRMSHAKIPKAANRTSIASAMQTHLRNAAGKLLSRRDSLSRALHLDDAASVAAELAIYTAAIEVAIYEATRRYGITLAQTINQLEKLKRELRPLAGGRSLRRRDREQRIEFLQKIADPAGLLPERAFDKLAKPAEDLARRLAAKADCVQSARELLQATEFEQNLLKHWQHEWRKVEKSVETKRALCGVLRELVWEKFAAQSISTNKVARREFIRLVLKAVNIVHPGKNHDRLLDRWIGTEITLHAPDSSLGTHGRPAGRPKNGRTLE
jgi:hypothetical protein